MDDNGSEYKTNPRHHGNWRSEDLENSTHHYADRSKFNETYIDYERFLDYYNFKTKMCIFVFAPMIVLGLIGNVISIIHYDDVIMTTIASEITSLTIVYPTFYSGADQSKHQSSASLAFVWGIHRGPVNSPHKGPVTRKMFPFDDVIMYLGEIDTSKFSYIPAPRSSRHRPLYTTLRGGSSAFGWYRNILCWWLAVYCSWCTVAL